MGGMVLRARSGLEAFNELRSALFATVSQSSCRALARRSFQHLWLMESKHGETSTTASDSFIGPNVDLLPLWGGRGDPGV